MWCVVFVGVVIYYVFLLFSVLFFYLKLLFFRVLSFYVCECLLMLLSDMSCNVVLFFCSSNLYRAVLFYFMLRCFMDFDLYFVLFYFVKCCFLLFVYLCVNFCCVICCYVLLCGVVLCRYMLHCVFVLFYLVLFSFSSKLYNNIYRHLKSSLTINLKLSCQNILTIFSLSIELTPSPHTSTSLRINPAHMWSNNIAKIINTANLIKTVYIENNSFI